MITIAERATLPNNNLLDCTEQTFICTVNTEGAMGRGIALDVKTRYPDIYKVYHKACKAGEYHDDTFMVFKLLDGRQCLLFPTKRKWFAKSPVDMIVSNIYKLAAVYEQAEITSLALPPLGGANGWLSEKQYAYVEANIISALKPLPIQCTLYK